MGSSLPTGGPWHARQAEVSPGPGRGQRGPRYAIHAGRHLTDKEFRYLKRVIVTPAVYRCFTRLYPGFTYRHWAGVGPSTNPFGLAGTCVFIKQSGPPSHCDLRVTHPQAPLLPKLRGQFAEFPRPGFPRHALGFSPRGTCVGSRYGRGGSEFPEGFSRAPGIGGTPLTGGPFALSPGSRHYGTPRAYTLSRPHRPVRLPRGVTLRACVAAPTPAVREYKPVSLSPAPSYGRG